MDLRIKTNWSKKNDPYLSEAFYLANYRLQEKKKAIRVMESDKAVKKAAQKYKKEVIADFTDWTYGCMALALHRSFGWGAKRIARLLEELEVVRAELIGDNLESPAIWDMVKSEIGLDVAIVDGFDWVEEEAK